MARIAFDPASTADAEFTRLLANATTIVALKSVALGTDYTVSVAAAVNADGAKAGNTVIELKPVVSSTLLKGAARKFFYDRLTMAGEITRKSVVVNSATVLDDTNRDAFALTVAKAVWAKLVAGDIVFKEDKSTADGKEYVYEIKAGNKIFTGPFSVTSGVPDPTLADFKDELEGFDAPTA